MKKLLLLILLLSSFAVGEENFSELVSALKQQDDTLAITLVKKLESEGVHSFGLFYNAGLAYRNQGRDALARAYFERALTFKPRDMQTRRRLREVKGSLTPQLAKLDVNGTPWWSEGEAKLALLLPSLALLGLGLRKRFGAHHIRRLHLGILTALTLTVGGVIFLNNPATNRAVLISSSCQLLAQPEPGESGSAVAQGVMVEILEHKNHFTRIRFGDGNSGWVRQAELLPVSGSL